MPPETLHPGALPEVPPGDLFVFAQEMERFRAEQTAIAKEQHIALPDDGFFASLRHHTPDLQTQEDLRAKAEEHVRRFIKVDPDNPHLFTEVARTFHEFSPLAVGEAEWHEGRKDSPSGISQFQEKIKAIIASNNGVENDLLRTVEIKSPVANIEHEYDLLYSGPRSIEDQQDLLNLEGLRKKAAALSVERGRKLHEKGKKRQKLEQDFLEADKAYKEAHLKLIGTRMSRLQSKAGGVSDEAMQAHAVSAAIQEHRRFTHTEVAIRNSDDSRMGRLAKFMAHSNKHLFLTSFGIGAGLGIGARIFKAGTVTALAVGMTGGAAAGLGLALGSTRAFAKATIGVRREHLQRQEQWAREDYAAFKSELEQNKSAAQTFEVTIGRLHEVISNRIEINQRTNRQRAIRAAGIGAVSGALGASVPFIFDGVSFALDHFSLPWGHPEGMGDTKPATPESTPTTPPSETQSPPTTTPTEPETPPNSDNPYRVEGFKTNVPVEITHGQTDELIDLAAQKDIHLTGTESYAILQDVLKDTHGANMFTDVRQYDLGNGDEGLAYPKAHAHLNPAFVHAFQHELEEHNKLKSAA